MEETLQLSYNSILDERDALMDEVGVSTALPPRKSYGKIILIAILAIIVIAIFVALKFIL